MKTRDLLFTIAVIVYTLLLGAGLAMMSALYIMDSMDSFVFGVVVASFGPFLAILATTATLNIRAGRLRPVNTGVQCAFLALSGYGIPLAVWGIVLLTKQRRSADS